MALYHDPSGKLDIDKPAEDDGGVEDEGEGPEGDPERGVVDTVILRTSWVIQNLQKASARNIQHCVSYDLMHLTDLHNWTELI